MEREDSSRQEVLRKRIIEMDFAAVERRVMAFLNCKPLNKTITGRYIHEGLHIRDKDR